MVIVLSGNNSATNTRIAKVIAQLGLTWHFLGGGGSIRVEGIDGDNQNEIDAFFELVDSAD